MGLLSPLLFLCFLFHIQESFAGGCECRLQCRADKHCVEKCPPCYAKNDARMLEDELLGGDIEDLLGEGDFGALTSNIAGNTGEEDVDGMELEEDEEFDDVDALDALSTPESIDPLTGLPVESVPPPDSIDPLTGLPVESVSPPASIDPLTGLPVESVPPPDSIDPLTGLPVESLFPPDSIDPLTGLPVESVSPPDSIDPLTGLPVVTSPTDGGLPGDEELAGDVDPLADPLVDPTTSLSPSDSTDPLTGLPLVPSSSEGDSLGASSSGVEEPEETLLGASGTLGSETSAPGVSPIPEGSAYPEDLDGSGESGLEPAATPGDLVPSLPGTSSTEAPATSPTTTLPDWALPKEPTVGDPSTITSSPVHDKDDLDIPTKKGTPEQSDNFGRNNGQHGVIFSAVLMTVAVFALVYFTFCRRPRRRDGMREMEMSTWVNGDDDNGIL